MISRVVERRGGMQDRFLGEIEDFGDVEGEEGGAFYACLYFLCRVTSESVGACDHKKRAGGEGVGRTGEREGREGGGRTGTLNSFMMGMISASRASFVTSPPRRSILLPTKITGTYSHPNADTSEREQKG